MAPRACTTVRAGGWPGRYPGEVGRRRWPHRDAGQLGIFTFSPRLDTQNSVRGVKIFSTSPRHGPAAVSDQHSVPGCGRSPATRQTIIRLQGTINFTAAENILTSSPHNLGGEELVATSQVTSFNRMGRRMVRRGCAALRESGFECAIYDPEGVVTDLEFSDGTTADTVDSF